MTTLHPRDGFVFIVTYGRSGSTLLQSILQSIDGYFIRGENMNALWGLYQSVKKASLARFEHGKNGPVPPHDPWYGANDIDPVRYGRALKDVFIEQVLQPPVDARVVGFKEIRFHEGGTDCLEAYLDFIAEYFSPAKFIFNCRNWEDVAQSGWWAKMKPERVRELIENCDSQYESYCRKHPDTSYIVRYDHVNGSPENMSGLFEFLGESFDLERISKVMAYRLNHLKWPQKKVQD